MKKSTKTTDGKMIRVSVETWNNIRSCLKYGQTPNELINSLVSKILNRRNKNERNLENNRQL